jgi:hypothetical protein
LHDDVAHLGRVAVDVDDLVEVGAIQDLARMGDLLAPQRPGLLDQRLVRLALPAGAGVEVLVWNIRRMSIRSSITRRNQLCSTRAMWRTIPSTTCWTAAPSGSRAGRA